MRARLSVRAIAADALHRLRYPLVPTLVMVATVLAGVVGVFATAGLAMASQQSALSLLNSPQGRLITLADPNGDAGLSATSVESLSSLSGVEWVLGVGAAQDAGNQATQVGEPVPVRTFYGRLPPTVQATRDPAPGEILLATGQRQRLRLGGGTGGLRIGQQSAVVVGTFQAELPLQGLNDVALRRAGPQSDGKLLMLWLSVRDVTLIEPVAKAAVAAASVKQAGALQVNTRAELASLSADVVADLARSSRLTIGAVITSVAALLCVVQFGRVAGISRDIGRRRALGATRSQIILQALINAALCSLIGTALGVGLGLAISYLVTGGFPPIGFTAGLSVLMLLAALIGTIPPAIRASRVDPVRILRVA